MKFKLRIATVALMAMATAPAWALQLGQIQVKSALNQALVAAIPVHPKNLTELDGLTVGLASAEDFARAGLQLTPTDQTLRFHVVTDNNGQKLILVTSSQPITDPYLDFLVQVNTRQGKQIREFVVLLNPVIASPAPAVQMAPAASAPVAAPPPTQPAELPPQSEFPQPAAQLQSKSQPQPQPQPQPQRPAQPQAAPKPRVTPQPQPPPAAAVQPGQQISVHRGDTLYGIARDASKDTNVSINQLMMALKSANPKAFFKNNINNLKADAILRIPTRDEIDKTSIAEANAEVHRQYEAWRAVKPHPTTVVEGSAAQAAARTAPQPGPAAPASDHLALVPPTGEASGAGNRPGVAGGTGSETVSGLQQRLQTERGTLISLNQSNADLESRVHSLKDIAGKSDKLLSLKDATVAELQHKLAAVQSGAPAAIAAPTAAKPPATITKPVSNAATSMRTVGEHVAGKPHASANSWFQRPVTWIVAGLIVLALIVIGFLLRRRRGSQVVGAGRGPLPDPDDVSPVAGAPGYEASLRAQLEQDPDNLDIHLALCRLYYAQGDTARFIAAAEAMHAHIEDPGSMEWHEVAVMGEEIAPGNPLFALPSGLQPVQSHEDPYGLTALRQPVDEGVVVRAPDVPGTAAPDTENIPDPEHGQPMADVPLATME
ncbi:MAG: type IV pilus assembly protein FimV, partial [Rhodanobacteraceae bacterium]